jgi:hypothetical protein
MLLVIANPSLLKDLNIGPLIVTHNHNNGEVILQCFLNVLECSTLLSIRTNTNMVTMTVRMYNPIRVVHTNGSATESNSQ